MSVTEPTASEELFEAVKMSDRYDEILGRIEDSSQDAFDEVWKAMVPASSRDAYLLGRNARIQAQRDAGARQRARMAQSTLGRPKPQAPEPPRPPRGPPRRTEASAPETPTYDYSQGGPSRRQPSRFSPYRPPREDPLAALNQSIAEILENARSQQPPAEAPAPEAPAPEEYDFEIDFATEDPVSEAPTTEAPEPELAPGPTGPPPPRQLAPGPTGPPPRQTEEVTSAPPIPDVVNESQGRTLKPLKRRFAGLKPAMSVLSVAPDQGSSEPTEDFTPPKREVDSTIAAEAKRSDEDLVAQYGEENAKAIRDATQATPEAPKPKRGPPTEKPVTQTADKDPSEGRGALSPERKEELKAKEAQRPEEPPKEASREGKCGGTTQAGNPCNRKAVAGSQFCRSHEEATQAGIAAMKTPAQEAPPAPSENGAGIKAMGDDMRAMGERLGSAKDETEMREIAAEMQNKRKEMLAAGKQVRNEAKEARANAKSAKPAEPEIKRDPKVEAAAPKAAPKAIEWSGKISQGDIDGHLESAQNGNEEARSFLINHKAEIEDKFGEDYAAEIDDAVRQIKKPAPAKEKAANKEPAKGELPEDAIPESKNAKEVKDVLAGKPPPPPAQGKTRGKKEDDGGGRKN